MRTKDKMLKMVLNNEKLMAAYHYTMDDVEPLDVTEALDSKVVIIAAVARIIKDLKGATDINSQKQVHKKIFNYLNDKLLA